MTEKTSAIAEYIDLSPARTRALLGEIEEIEAIGGNSNREYNLVQSKPKNAVFVHSSALSFSFCPL